MSLYLNLFDYLIGTWTWYYVCRIIQNLCPAWVQARARSTILETENLLAGAFGGRPAMKRMLLDVRTRFGDDLSCGRKLTTEWLPCDINTFAAAKSYPSPLWVNGQSWLMSRWHGLIDDFFTTLRICRILQIRRLTLHNYMRYPTAALSAVFKDDVHISPWCLLSLSVGQQMPTVTNSVGLLQIWGGLASGNGACHARLWKSANWADLWWSLRRSVKSNRGHIWGWRTATSFS